MCTDDFRPGTPLLDYLRGRAEALDTQRGRETATKSKRGPTGGVGRENRRSLALVDGLDFLVVSQPSRSERAIKLIQERFRDSFLNVWSRIPEQDRWRLLRY